MPHKMMRAQQCAAATRPGPSKYQVQNERNARLQMVRELIAGIELMHRIRKGQFNLATLHLKDLSVPALWNAVLSYR